MSKLFALLALLGTTQAFTLKRDLPAPLAASSLPNFDFNTVKSFAEEEDFQKEVQKAKVESAAY